MELDGIRVSIYIYIFGLVAIRLLNLYIAHSSSFILDLWEWSFVPYIMFNVSDDLDFVIFVLPMEFIC